MKKTRRIAAFAAAMAMAATMAMPMAMTASAAETTPVSVSSDVHSFTAYQIFTGTWENPADGTTGPVLKGATIGGDVTKAKLIAEINKKLPEAKALASTAEDIDVAKALEDMSTDDILEILEADGVITGSGEALSTSAKNLDKGYYYIVESDGTSTGNCSILKCAANEALVVTPKMGAPRVEKKIKEDDRTIDNTNGTIGTYNDAAPAEGKTAADQSAKEGWNDAADYCIGEEVPFKIHGSMPANIDMYNHYFYQFKDRLAKGFVAPTAAKNNIKVYAINGTTKTDITSFANITFATVTADGPDKGSTNITITFDDIKSDDIKALTIINASTVIAVEYSAVLGENAVIGALGNTNGVKLFYSKDTSYDGSGIDTDTDDKGKDDEGNDTPGSDGESDNNQDDTPGNDTGKTEDDGVVAFTYTIDSTKVDSVSGIELPGAKFKLLDSTKTKAAKIENGVFNGWAEDIEGGTEITTIDDGKFTVKGLDSEATYYIKETAAPAGYNMLTEEVAVDVKMYNMNNIGTYNYVKDNGTGAYGALDGASDDDTVPKSTFNGNNITETSKNGIVSGNIANAKGSTLPSTGGMGTRLFVLGGGCMAGLAGLYLVSKKRSKDAE